MLVHMPWFDVSMPGNIVAKPPQSPSTEPVMTTPTLKSKVYTTGRGGAGNLAKNDDPEEARIAQDVDVPGITLPEGPTHTGRGKYGALKSGRHLTTFQAGQRMSTSHQSPRSLKQKSITRRCGASRSTRASRKNELVSKELPTKQKSCSLARASQSQAKRPLHLIPQDDPSTVMS